MSAVLHLEDVWKAYPGVIALHGANLTLRPGEVHALLGENGAGKSTLMGVASGTVVPDRGNVTIGGQPLSIGRTSHELGIAMVYQDGSLAPDLPIRDNVALLALGSQGTANGHYRASVEQLQQKFGLDLAATTPVRHLAAPERQVVEIARAIALRPRILLLDEPTAALGAAETDCLHQELTELARAGAAILYVTHRLQEIFRIADVVSVMRDGRMIAAERPISDVDTSALLELMAGRPVEAAFPPRSDIKPRPLLRVRDLVTPRGDRLSLEVREGEIVGFTGIEGEGQREVLRALGGLSKRDGEVIVDDTSVRPSNIHDARDKGLVFVSAERRTESLFMSHSVRDNITITSLDRYSVGPWLNLQQAAMAAQDAAERLHIQAVDTNQGVTTLSGGNQQKVVLARALLDSARVLLIEEPTQGIDARTRTELYEFLRSMATTGSAIIVLSSDAVELAGLCDRVIVFARGGVSGELKGSDLTEQSVIAASATSSAHRTHSSEESLVTGIVASLRRGGDFPPIVLLTIMLVALAGVASLGNPIFLTTANIGNLLFLTVPLGLAAVAQAIAMTGRGIDLSIGPSMALATVAVAQVTQMFMLRGQITAIVLSVAVALLIGCSLGFLNGALVVIFRLQPLLATLATFVFVQGIALLWSPTTGGVVAPAFMSAMRVRLSFVPWTFLLLIVLALMLEYLYRRSTLGLTLRATGSHRRAASRMGVKIRRVEFASYVAAGLIGSIAGLFFAATIGVGDPRLGIYFSLASIAAAVLGGVSIFGGRGSILGAVGGALLLSLIANISAFYNFPAQTQMYVRGGLTLLGIAFYSWLYGSEDELVEREVMA